MGSSQSKPAETEVHRQLIERLRAMDLQGRQRQAEANPRLEKDYVFVNDETRNEEAPPSYSTTATQDVSIAAAERWERQLLQDPKNRLALSAFTNNNPTSIIASPAAKIADQQTFNVRISLEGSPVTNQRSSGRCWLFASTNVFRIALMKKHNLKEFELSQAYLFFWDKLEKANYFLESILDTTQEPLDGRLMQTLLAGPVGDGGQWDMVANLVKKYGLVPQTLYPDSFNAMNSSIMDRLITTKLREDALRLRLLASKRDCGALSAAKEAMLQEVHLILTLMLGAPPSPSKEFTWEFQDKDGKYQSISKTPMEFAKELSAPRTVRALGGTDVNQLFSLVHDPRNAYETLLTVERLGNVYGGLPIRYVNVKMSDMKKACITMLQRGLPIFFGSDVGKYSDSARGIMDTALFDYELGFNVRLGLSKAERLQTGESAMTHAMTLTGVQMENGKDVRWRVENSWSDKAGDKGYFVMSAAWFDEFVYQAVVEPSCVGQAVRDVLNSKPKVLPLWDPMGALA